MAKLLKKVTLNSVNTNKLCLKLQQKCLIIKRTLSWSQRVSDKLQLLKYKWLREIASERKWVYFIFLNLTWFKAKLFTLLQYSTFP